MAVQFTASCEKPQQESQRQAPAKKPNILLILAEDPAELNDLSGEHPDRVDEMVKRWEQYKEDNTVLDVALDLSRGI